MSSAKKVLKKSKPISNHKKYCQNLLTKAKIYGTLWLVITNRKEFDEISWVLSLSAAMKGWNTNTNPSANPLATKPKYSPKCLLTLKNRLAGLICWFYSPIRFLIKWFVALCKKQTKIIYWWPDVIAAALVLWNAFWMNIAANAPTKIFAAVIAKKLSLKSLFFLSDS